MRDERIDEKSYAPVGRKPTGRVLRRLPDLKDAVIDAVDSARNEMLEVSEKIHDNPELGLKEFRTSELLSSILQKAGFAVERGIAGMPTAFKATFHNKRPGLNLAYLAEYDALPEIGHGCGHNIIGTAAVFAGISLSKLSEQLSGQVTVFGTPDEEGAGGKITMVKAGSFDGVDAAIMTHPWNFTSPWMPSVGVSSLTIEFTGKTAHYSTPHRGSNALDGVVLTLAALNGIRHNFRNDVVYGYTIDQGGVSPSIIPEKASARLWIKSTDVRNLIETVDRVKALAGGIAASIGGKVTVEPHYPLFEESIPNLTLMQEFSKNLSRLGIPFKTPEETSRSLAYVSTDYGNVSHVVPGIAAAISICPETLSAHTPEFAQAAISKRGGEALVAVTKAMAMTGAEVLSNPEFAESVKAEFVKYRTAGFSNVPLAPIY